MASPPTQRLDDGRAQTSQLVTAHTSTKLAFQQNSNRCVPSTKLAFHNKTATSAYLCATADPVPNANPCAMVDAMPASMPPPPLFCWAGGWAAGRGAGGALLTNKKDKGKDERGNGRK